MVRWGGNVRAPVYCLLLEHRWAHIPGLTILEDAARLMSQFAGEGVNLGMVDGFELSVVLADAIAGRRVRRSTATREAPAIVGCEEAKMKEGRRVGAMAA